MRRTRLRAGLLAVVLLLLGGIGWQVWRRVSVHGPKALERLGEELLPHVAQHIRNFRRVKVKEGKTVWEITADDAQYSEESSEIVVTHPQVTLYLDDGKRQAKLTGREGRLFINANDRSGRDLQSVALNGEVVVWLDDLQLRTEHATYERALDRITIPDDVTIVGTRMDVKARRMEVDVTPQLVRLQGDVRTVLRNDAAKAS
jgi:LPS export ABC transporter protein LptC